jgi:hypothetical protein
MWIKAFLPVSVLMAVVPAPGGAPAPSPVLPRATAAAASFATICRDGELPERRPDSAWVAASFANDGCRLAPLPAAIDGAAVPRERIVSAMAEAKRYEAVAAAFQQCVSAFVAARARGSAPLTTPQRLIEQHRMLVGQKSRDAAAAQVRAAIEAFNMYGSDCEG